MTLAPGKHPIPPSHATAVVTYLALDADPPRRPAQAPEGVVLERMPLDLDRYRALFRRVGDEWLWWSRLQLDDADLEAIVGDPAVEVHALRREDTDLGLLELDFRPQGSADLAFFGLDASLHGTTASRWMMNQALDRLFARVPRVTINTCTFDHPAALPFYRRTGFAVLRQEVKVVADPRLDGTLPRDAASHVPLVLPEPSR